MPIDFEKEMAAAGFADGGLAQPYDFQRWVNELLRGILHRRATADLDAFVAGVGKHYWGRLDAENYTLLFGVWWMSHLKKPHMLWIYRHLAPDFGTRKIFGRFLADTRIAAPRRAFFYHAVFEAWAHGVARRPFSLPHFWWDNGPARGAYARVARPRDEDAVILRLGLPYRHDLSMYDALEEAMDKDSVSLFEMQRKLCGRPISDSMMQELVVYDAARCFVHLLSHYPRRVFKLRSPEEWLITVCRCARDELAVAAVDELERQFPGIVARTRDPWGNTPLWNMLHKNAKEKLEAELIRFGCDPDSTNVWGLSYRLLRDNDPRELLADELEENGFAAGSARGIRGGRLTAKRLTAEA